MSVSTCKLQMIMLTLPNLLGYLAILQTVRTRYHKTNKPKRVRSSKVKEVNLWHEVVGLGSTTFLRNQWFEKLLYKQLGAVKALKKWHGGEE